MKKIITAGLVLFVSLLVFPFYAQAATRKGIQISPLTYNFEIQDSASTTGKIIITNLNDQELNYSIEVEDFSSVSDSGAPSFGAVHDENAVTTLSDWFTFDSPKEGALAAHTDLTVTFTITIPAGAEPGGHYAAVFAKEVKKTAEGRTELGVASRVGTLILVSVPGITTNGVKISDFKFPRMVWQGPVNLSLKATNTGTVHYDSKSEVKVESMFGGVNNVSMGTHTVLPGNHRAFSGTWGSKFPFGRYTATASVTDGNGQIVTTSGIIWALPLMIVIPLLILIILIVLAIRYAKKHLKFVK